MNLKSFELPGIEASTRGWAALAGCGDESLTAVAVDVELGTDAPGVVPKLREAVEQSRQVEIDYYSLSSDET